MGAMGGGSRPRLLYSSKHFLLVLVGNSSIVLGLQLCLLLLVCLLCISKDVHEMFTLAMVSLNEFEKQELSTYSADNFARLVQDRDSLHERHLGGVVIG